MDFLHRVFRFFVGKTCTTAHFFIAMSTNQKFYLIRNFAGNRYISQSTCIIFSTFFSRPSEKLPETSIKSEDELDDAGDIETEDIDIDVVSDKEDCCDLDSSKDPLDRPGSKSPESTTSDSHSTHTKGSAADKAAKLEMKSKGNCPDLESIDCHLETKELWEKFFELGTEMIITKTGR